MDYDMDEIARFINSMTTEELVDFATSECKPTPTEVENEHEK